MTVKNDYLVDDQDQTRCECEGGYFTSSDGLDCIQRSCTGDCGVMGCCGDHCCRLVPSNSDLGDLQINGSLRVTGEALLAAGSGRVRINTKTGFSCTGSMTPPPEEGLVTVR